MARRSAAGTHRRPSGGAHRGTPAYQATIRTAAPAVVGTAVLAVGVIVPGTASAASVGTGSLDGLTAGLPVVGPVLTASPNDPRAKEVAGNATNCATGSNNIGVPGEAYGVGAGGDAADVVTFERGELGKTYLDILSVKEGYEVTAVVVKGGNAYNVYRPEAMSGATGLGELPWKDLRSPDNASGKPAAISHWYVCVIETKAAATAEETETAPTDETPADETPADETPAEETPTEEAPAEEAPAEEAPTEEAPTEEAETTEAEEAPAEEAATPEDVTPEDVTPEDATSEDATTQEEAEEEAEEVAAEARPEAAENRAEAEREVAAVRVEDARVRSAALPRTGAADPGLLFLGIGLVAAGTGLVAAGRGRHRRPSPPSAS